MALIEPAPDLRIVDDEPAIAGHVVRLVGGHELEELDRRCRRPRPTWAGRRPRCRRGPVALRTAGCTWSHQNDQNASHSLRDVVEREARRSSRLFQTWRWLVARPIGSPYRALCPVFALSSMHPGERVRIEQVREVADGVREVHEPILEGPLADVVVQAEAEGEVGRLAGLERRHDLVRKLLLWMEDELDLLAGLLLEGGDDLPDRLVLLGVVALLPPHHEVGGPGAERRQDQRGGKNNGANSQHGRLPEVIAQHTPIAAAPGPVAPIPHFRSVSVPSPIPIP